MMENIFLWAQILGFIALTLCVIQWQIKKSKNIVLINIPCNIFWAVHFFLLGSPQALIAYIAAILRDTALLNLASKHSLKIIIISTLSIWVIGLSYIEQAIELIPLIGASLANIGFLFYKNRKLIARANLLSCLVWLPYCFMILSWPSLIANGFICVSILIGMYRHEKWNLGKCYKTFLPSLYRSLFPNFKTYP